MSVVQMDVRIAQVIVEDKKEPEYHKIVYLSIIHPNDEDMAEVAVVKVSVMVPALDVMEAIQLFSNNVPEHYPVKFVLLVEPTGIKPDDILPIQRGPRQIN